MNPDNSFWKAKRVLITGHTGFKGTWLALLLDGFGARVAGLALAPDTEPSLFAQTGLAQRIDHRIGDIRDATAAKAALEKSKPDIIFHLAAQSLVRRSYDQPIETLHTNVLGTANILEAARNAPGLKAVVVATSDKCYENRERTEPYREDDALGGCDLYSASKAAAEIVTHAYRQSFFGDKGALIASVRAGNVMGGGDWAEDRLVPDCMRAFAKGNAVKIRHPDATRPWQHVLEPLVGYVLLAQRLHDGNRALATAFNFGPSEGDNRRVRDVVSELAGLWGHGARWETDPGANLHEAGLLSVNSDKARRELKWSPRLTLAQTLAWTTAWYRAVADGAGAAEMTRKQIADYLALGPAR